MQRSRGFLLYDRFPDLNGTASNNVSDFHFDDDVGSAPVRIIETELYLDVMASTRLYVLDEDRLVALEDCSAKCDLPVCGERVLLVKANGVRVFAHDGRALGIALTKAPIRRTYVEDGDLVIETRIHRGRFRGIQ